MGGFASAAHSRLDASLLGVVLIDAWNAGATGDELSKVLTKATRRRLIQAFATVSSVTLLCACGGGGGGGSGSAHTAYTVIANVSGLSGSGLVLQLNTGSDLAVTAIGNSTFATPLVSGSSYQVTVKTQPSSPQQTCTVANGSGTIGATDVTVSVSCLTTVVTLYSFTGNAPGSSDGAAPNGSLVQGDDGSLYGTTLGTVFRITTSGEETTLYSFLPPSSGNYGGVTSAGLIVASDGNFYGTTQGNGIGNNISGTVYQISPAGAETIINTFSGADQGDLVTRSGVIQGRDGLLYGIAFGSMIFAMTTAGAIQTEAPIGGYISEVSLVQAGDGTLYGTTSAGGPNVTGPLGTGTVFKSVPGSGEVTTIYIFKGNFGGPPGDGAAPGFPLVEGSDGNLYGTTAYGGNPSAACPQGCGTVFRITPSGAETALYSFGASAADGQSPSGALVLASDGNFYGTTLAGGSPNANCKATNGCGTLYRVTPSGVQTVLYSFGTNASDGIGASGALLQASDGNLYGTTMAGGAANQGTVFKLVLSTN